MNTDPLTAFPSHRCSAIVAEPAPLFRQALCGLIAMAGVQPVEAASWQQLVERMESLAAQSANTALILVDRCLPGLKSFEQITLLARRHGCRILMTAEVTDELFVSRAQRAGVGPVVSKASTHEQFMQALQSRLSFDDPAYAMGCSGY